jgi:hypothetical protein
MAWSTPTTRSAGYVVPNTEWNQNTVDNPIALRAGGIAIASQAANDIPYASSSTQLTRSSSFTFDGTTFTTPGQIAFPASQNASSGANTLDDFEESTFTPTIGGSGGQSGQAYTVQLGSYQKVGKWVTVNGYIQLSTLGTVTTNVQIKGLPFTSENVSNRNVPVTIGYWTNMSSSFVTVGGLLAPNDTAITLYGVETAAATGMSTLTQADLADTTIIAFSVRYAATA